MIEKESILSNQRKLKAIYDLEKDMALPFPTIELNRGVYWFTDESRYENMSKEELTDRINQLYIENRVAMMPQNERNEYVENIELEQFKISLMTEDERAEYIKKIEHERIDSVETLDDELKIYDAIKKENELFDMGGSVKIHYDSMRRDYYVDENSRNIRVIDDKGGYYYDTFKTIDKATYNGQELYLLQNEIHEDEPFVIVDGKNNVIMEDVKGWNDYEKGREDLIHYYDLDKPVSFITENSLPVYLDKYYTLPYALQFVDKNNKAYELYLGGVGESNNKPEQLIMKLDDTYMYSETLNEQHAKGEINLSEPIDFDAYDFQPLHDREERFRQLKSDTVIAKIISVYEDKYENTKITSWWGDMALWEFKSDVTYEELEARLNKALEKLGKTLEEVSNEQERIDIMSEKELLQQMEENANSLENAPYTPSSEDMSVEDMKKEAIMKGVGAVMNSNEFANYAKTVNRLMYNNYSPRNCGLILEQYIYKYCEARNIDVLKLSGKEMGKVVTEALQSDDVPTYVMGYEAWKDFGRQVKGKNVSYSIVAPNYVSEYNGKGTIIRAIEKKFKEDFEKDGNRDYSEFVLGKTGLSFRGYGQKGNNLVDICMNGKTILGKQGIEDVRKFLDNEVIGKMPNGYSVTYVYDVKDVVVPEHLWVKSNFKKSELVLDENGEPVTRKAYKNSNVLEYKIKNSKERIDKFNPDLSMEVTGLDDKKAEILFETLQEVSLKKGVPMSVEEIKGSARGYFNPADKRIAISENLDPVSKCATAIHEMAHADLHSSKDGKNTNTREVEAEAVAYMTAQHFGINTDVKSFNYLAGWSTGRDLKELESSMGIILKESKKLEREISKELENRGYNISLELINKEPTSNMEVAIESTDDFEEPGFEKNNGEEFYRVVAVNEDGKVKPVDNKVYSSYEEAKNSIDASYKLMDYDEIIHKAGELLEKKAEAEKSDKILEGEQAKEDFIKQYKEFVVNEKSYLEELKEDAKDLLLNTSDERCINILKEQIDNINQQNRKLVTIDKNLNQLENTTTVEEFKKISDRVVKHYADEIDLKNKFSELSHEYTERLQDIKTYEQASVREKFNLDPVKVIKDCVNELADDKFKKLTEKDIKYIATSDYLEREHGKDVRSGNVKAYIEKGMERLDIIDNIKAKNGQFVEVSFCEKWFDEPIVEDGALIHPATANKIFGDAEKDIKKIKEVAKANGEYVPYSKCKISLYTETKDGLQCTTTRMDIGDGYQKNLSDFLQKTIKDKNVLEAYEKASKERVKDKIYEPTSTGRSGRSQDDAELKNPHREDKLTLSAEELKQLVEERSEKETGTKSHTKQRQHDRGSLSK